MNNYLLSIILLAFVSLIWGGEILWLGFQLFDVQDRVKELEKKP